MAEGGILEIPADVKLNPADEIARDEVCRDLHEKGQHIGSDKELHAGKCLLADEMIEGIAIEQRINRITDTGHRPENRHHDDLPGVRADKFGDRRQPEEGQMLRVLFFIHAAPPLLLCSLLFPPFSVPSPSLLVRQALQDSSQL